MKTSPTDLSFNTGEASSWDPQTREFEAVIVSGPGVVAVSNQGERVTFDAAGLDDSGIRAGTVPLLNEHDRYEQLGKVIGFSAARGRATVRIRLDPPDTHPADSHEGKALKALETRLDAGTQAGFSMRVADIEVERGLGGEEKVIRVARARITEVSATTMPGDPGATALSAPDNIQPAKLGGTTVSGPPMTKDNTQPDQPASTQPTEVALSAGQAAPTEVSLSSGQMDELADRLIARQARRQQRLTSEVNKVAAEYELSAEQRQELATAGLTGTDLCFRANEMSKANRSASLGAPVGARTSRVGRETDRVQETREAALSVLEARVKGEKIDREASKVFHAWDVPSLLDLAQGMAFASGSEAGLGRGGAQDLAFSALVRDDLPDVMRELINKRLSDSAPRKPPIYTRLSRRRPVRDFSTILTAGSSGFSLTPREEGGETRHSEIKEEGTTYKLRKSDTLATMSHEIIVGDNIGFIQNLIASAPVAVTASLEEMFHESFTTSGLKFDGSDLFSTSRGNQQAGQLTKNNLNAAVSKMQKITDLTGNPLNLDAAFLLVPSDLEGMAREVLLKRQGNPSVVVDAGDVSVHAGSIEVIASPWLQNSNVSGNSATAWYLFADPAELAGVEHAVFEREPGPYFATRMETNRDMTFYLANAGAFAVANPRAIVKGTGV